MKISTILSVVLAAQLLLAAGMAWNHYSAGNDTQSSPLLDFDISRVDRIEIDDNQHQAVLAKTGENWQLPDMHALAANQSKVTGLLDNLKSLETGWPVATTQGSIERLEVDEDKYQRKLRLLEGERELGEYYFGSSPGFRQTHGRRAGDDEVFALAINNFDMPGDANDWLDKGLLSVSDVEKIGGPDFSVVKEEDNWRFDHVETGEESLDQNKVNNIVSAFSSLRVLRVAESLPDSEAITVTVGDKENTWTYDFYKDEDTYYLKRGDMDAGFTISKSSYDRIAGVSRDMLLKEPMEKTEESGAGEDEAA